MSIAQSLPEIDPFCLQECPLCGRSNRIVMKGVYRKDNKIELQPDTGYSFCNCKSIFYTRPENIAEEIRPEFQEILPMPDDNGEITYPDPFFAWPDPYQFLHWDIRKYRILWDMDSLVDYLKEIGYEVLSAERDFKVGSSTPQHFHIKVKLCPEL